MKSSTKFPVDWCRAQFPALKRVVAGQPVAFFDGPGGSQVPQRVIDAVGHYLARTNANRGGQYATARESDALLESAHATMAEFLGTPNPESIVFGANMTTLTFALSRAISKSWKPGDEIIVTRLDHDGNVTPWSWPQETPGQPSTTSISTNRTALLICKIFHRSSRHELVSSRLVARRILSGQ
jgi:selenocysteine lyase/cysteine desulfurase